MPTAFLSAFSEVGFGKVGILSEFEIGVVVISPVEEEEGDEEDRDLE